jgi:hypothetical protein
MELTLIINHLEGLISATAKLSLYLKAPDHGAGENGGITPHILKLGTTCGQLHAAVLSPPPLQGKKHCAVNWRVGCMGPMAYLDTGEETSDPAENQTLIL